MARGLRRRISLKSRQVMKQLLMVTHGSDHWKPEEDKRLIELVEAGKSWVLISAILKRSVKTLQNRHRLLRRRTDRSGT